ncbi:hypothetical protein K1X12_07970 [Hyphomonas sp. WL0036]|uniref:hypothetical protein n=1 Tax=Hyphomonas sediminis TaxID=2866160 RepID=UPI001C80AE96|nr:hypothetical protein [Hyphomonas sediminis]MBY9066833.1 hypothetical protein [Hyphomonas sediminis]
MSLKRISLQPALNPGAEVVAGQGYTIIAPLTAEGRLDLDAWRANRADCRVYRLHPDPAERADGWLTHRGNRWFFRYDEEEEGDDENVYRLGDHVFREGEYVTVEFHGEQPLTYKVVDVSEL